MAEKRTARRLARRLKVRFGEKERGGFTSTGLTNDISSTGMFVSTNAVAAITPGTRLHLEVTTPENQLMYFEGVVARQVVVPPELRAVIKEGFGLRFLTGSDLVSELVPAAQTSGQLRLTYETVAALRDAWERELKRGGAFCWTDRACALNSIVVVEVNLPFAGRRLTFDARVVHLVPEQQGRHGLAFMFVDTTGAMAALEALLR